MGRKPLQLTSLKPARYRAWREHFLSLQAEQGREEEAIWDTAVPMVNVVHGDTENADKFKKRKEEEQKIVEEWTLAQLKIYLDVQEAIPGEICDGLRAAILSKCGGKRYGFLALQAMDQEILQTNQLSQTTVLKSEFEISVKRGDENGSTYVNRMATDAIALAEAGDTDYSVGTAAGTYKLISLVNLGLSCDEYKDFCRQTRMDRQMCTKFKQAQETIQEFQSRLATFEIEEGIINKRIAASKESAALGGMADTARKVEAGTATPEEINKVLLMAQDAKRGQGGQGGNGGGGTGFQGQCYNKWCKQWGHSARNCETPKPPGWIDYPAKGGKGAGAKGGGGKGGARAAAVQLAETQLEQPVAEAAIRPVLASSDHLH